MNYLWQSWFKRWFESPGQFLGSSNSRRYHSVKASYYRLKIRGPEQKRLWLFCCFNFERNSGILNSESMLFVEQKYKF